MDIYSQNSSYLCLCCFLILFFSPLIYRFSLQLPIYNTSYPALLFALQVTVCPNFLRYSPRELSRLPPTMIESLFNKCMSSNFPYSLQIFIDDSVSPTSAGFSFFLPSLNIYANKLIWHASLFTAKCYTLINALQLISYLNFINFLIISYSQSCLLAIIYDSFNSPLSPRILNIKSLIKFYWIHSHVGISGNHLAFKPNLTFFFFSITCY